MNLRIASIFITGLATTAGMFPLVAIKKERVSSLLLLCIRAASAGSMLSLALVHILPEAGHRLESTSSYPIAGVAMAFGVFFASTFQLVVSAATPTNILGQRLDGGCGVDECNTSGCVIEPPKGVHVPRASLICMEAGCILHGPVLSPAPRTAMQSLPTSNPHKRRN
jgi:zinc transporter ZupT